MSAPTLMRVSCARCDWSDVVNPGTELAELREHYDDAHPGSNKPTDDDALDIVPAHAEPADPDADRWLTLEVDRYSPGVLLLWGDESVSMAIDNAMVQPELGAPSAILRALMVTRLRWLADQIEATAL